ncbi:MAG: hypothetical protein R3C10_11395 [Pirellulales bacterium]
MPEHQAADAKLDEYAARTDRQALSAMDAAIAHPVGRIIAGFLFVCFMVALAGTVADLFTGDAPFWSRWIRAFVFFYAGVIWLVETGSIVLTGKSRFPWYRDVLTRWRRKGKC